MKRKLFTIAGALAALLALMVMAGCATTTQVTFAATELPQVTFAATEPPQVELKYAVIAATSRRGDSVLQRFYAEYPREKYQVVTCELVSKNWLPFVGGLGGALLGTAIGVPIGIANDLKTTTKYDSRSGWETTEQGSLAGMIVGYSLPAVGAVVGGLLGTVYKDKYIVAYVEKGGKPDILPPSGESLREGELKDGEL